MSFIIFLFNMCLTEIELCLFPHPFPSSSTYSEPLPSFPLLDQAPQAAMLRDEFSSPMDEPLTGCSIQSGHLWKHIHRIFFIMLYSSIKTHKSLKGKFLVCV